MTDPTTAARPRGRFVLALVALLLVVAIARAQQAVTEQYHTVDGAATPQRLAIDGSDSQDWTTPIGTLQETRGDTFIVVAPRWNTENATACVGVGFYDSTGHWNGIAVVSTLTASPTTGGRGTAPASGTTGYVYGVLNGQVMRVPTDGAPYYEVRYHDVSGSARVDSYPWSVGKSSKQAGQ